MNYFLVLYPYGAAEEDVAFTGDDGYVEEVLKHEMIIFGVPVKTLFVSV